jgi:hypothetical protein
MTTVSTRTKSKPYYLRNFPDHLKGKIDGVSRRSVAIRPDLSALQISARSSSSASDSTAQNSELLNCFKIGSFSFSESACRI